MTSMTLSWHEATQPAILYIKRPTHHELQDAPDMVPIAMVQNGLV